MRYFIKLFFVLLFAQSFTAACVFAADGSYTHTAKVVFSKNDDNKLVATVIPYTDEGSYPKSGWIVCEAIAQEITDIYSGKIKGEEKFEGYFIATYKKLGENRNSPILSYKGELLKIEPWSPAFDK